MDNFLVQNSEVSEKDISADAVVKQATVKFADLSWQLGEKEAELEELKKQLEEANATLTNLQGIELHPRHLRQLEEAGHRDVAVLVDVIQRRPRPRDADMKLPVRQLPVHTHRHVRDINMLLLLDLLVGQP